MNKTIIKYATASVILLNSLGMVNYSYADHGDDLKALQLKIQTLEISQTKLTSEIEEMKKAKSLVTANSKQSDGLSQLGGRNKSR